MWKGREKPLKKAKENAIRYGVFDKIDFILSDGLQKVPSFVDCVVVAGLGGKNILRIVLNKNFIRNRYVKFIIQPQSFLYLLRYNIYKNGGYIEKEIHLIENSKCYDVLVFRFYRAFDLSFEETLEFEDINREIILGEKSKENVYSYEFLKLLTLKEFAILNGLKISKNKDLKKFKIQEKICKILKKELELFEK